MQNRNFVCLSPNTKYCLCVPFLNYHCVHAHILITTKYMCGMGGCHNDPGIVNIDSSMLPYHPRVVIGWYHSIPTS